MWMGTIAQARLSSFGSVEGLPESCQAFALAIGLRQLEYCPRDTIWAVSYCTIDVKSVRFICRNNGTIQRIQCHQKCDTSRSDVLQYA